MAFSFAIELTNFIATGCIIRPFLLPLFGSPEIVAAGRGKAVAAALAAGIIAFSNGSFSASATFSSLDSARDDGQTRC